MESSVKLKSKTILCITISFLTIASIFTAITTFADYIFMDNVSILKNTYKGIVFGILITTINTLVYKNKLKKYGINNISLNYFRTKQNETIEKTKSLKEIYKSLTTNKYTKLWKLTITDDKIIGKTGASLFSWGEKIMIQEKKEQFEIESRSVLLSTIFDYGTNKENTLIIKEAIEG